MITYNSIHGTGSLLRHICYRRSLNNSTETSTSLLDRTGSPITPVRPALLRETPGSAQSSKITDLTKIKKEIEERIANNDPDIILKSPSNIKSEIWSNGNFKTIYQNGVKLDFVMCLLCKSLITYRSKTGTASLLRHSCMRSLNSSARNRTPIVRLELQSNDVLVTQAEIEQENDEQEVEIELEPEIENDQTDDKYVEVEEMPILSGSNVELDQDYYVELPAEYKEEAGKMLHCIIYQDLHSVNIANRKGFHDFGQYLINLGAELGKVNISNVLESRDAIHLGDNFVNILQKMLKNKFDEHKIALSCDIWEDLNRKTNFLTLYGHYIDEQYIMRKVNLGTENFPIDTNENNYKELLETILEQYISNTDDLQSFLSKSTVVVSNDLIRYFKSSSTVNCACWSLNLIVQNLLNQPIFKYLLPDELQIRDNWVNALEYLETLDKSSDVNILKVLKILNLFKVASHRLSVEENPTINEVCILKKKLEDEFSKLDDKNIIEVAHRLIKENFPVTNLHKIATFLDPRFKSLKFMKSDEKANVIHMTSKMLLSDDLGAHIVQQEQKSSVKIKSEKKEEIDCQDSAKYLIEYMDIAEDHDETHDEIDTYLNLKFNEIRSTNILDFWESRYDLPRLRQLAKEILCIPASGIATEKIFSDDASNFAKRRLNVEIENIKEMLFIHENFDMLSSLL